MHAYGRRPCAALAARLTRYRCPGCARVSTPGFVASRGRRGSGNGIGDPVLPTGVLVDPDFLPPVGPVSINPKGYPVITLGVGHPYANSGGWQYLARYVVMTTTDTLLRRDEEVHHDNGNRLDCRRENLKVMLAEHHGRHHARYQLLYMLRDRATGRWLPSDVPAYADQRDDQDPMRYSDEAMQDYANVDTADGFYGDPDLINSAYATDDASEVPF